MTPTSARAVLAVPCGPATVEGILDWPLGATAVVLFAHGGGPGPLSQRDYFIARELCADGLAALRFDLLSEGERADPARRFGIGLLADRLGAAVRFVGRQAPEAVSAGLLGTGPGAAAALRVAAALPEAIGAVVSCGGRPDLAGDDALARVRAPTLLIAGAEDHGVLGLNDTVYRKLTCTKALEIVPQATHRFAEPGALEELSRLAVAWFDRCFGPPPTTGRAR